MKFELGVYTFGNTPRTADGSYEGNPMGTGIVFTQAAKPEGNGCLILVAPPPALRPDWMGSLFFPAGTEH